MVILSRQDIERISRRILAVYLQRQDSSLSRIDPVSFATDMYGMEFYFRKLSYDGEILGMTSMKEFAVQVEDSEGFPEWFELDPQVALIDLSLLGDQQTGRRHFTMMHEVSHQILRMLFPTDFGLRYRICPVKYYMNRKSSDWEEWQANALASALLLPRELILKHLNQAGLTHIRLLNKHYAPKTYMIFSMMADQLGVSKQALAIRMKYLGLLQADYLRNPDDLVRIYVEDEEWKQLQTAI